MKKWLKVTIITDPSLVDSISDYLVGIMGAGVEIGVDDHISLTTLNAFVEKANPEKEEIESVVAQAGSHMADLASIFEVEPPQISWAVIEDEDWSKSWKKHFSPFTIITGLVIAPTWEKYQAGEGERVIVMDPGMAFGTGHHATTALTLELIAEELRDCQDAKSVLDVGTGTGILGMAAALFGAESVLGIDNDPDAVLAAGENILTNNLSSVMEAKGTPLANLEGQYSLVVANIIHDALVTMSGDLQKVTAGGGKLILSGILSGPQAENVVRVFEEHGFSSEKEMLRDEWAAIRFVKL